jgi:hypothetical protein
MIFWVVLKLDISYRVIISWRIFLFLLEDFFWRIYFHMGKYLNFQNSSFCHKILFNVNGKATVWHTPCYYCYYFLFSCMCEQRPKFFIHLQLVCEVWTTWSYSSLNLILVFLKIFLMCYMGSGFVVIGMLPTYHSGMLSSLCCGECLCFHKWGYSSCLCSIILPSLCWM